MAARDLFYKLGSQGYGDSKLAKWKIMIKKTVFHFSSLIYGEWAFSDATKNGTFFSRNYVCNSE